MVIHPSAALVTQYLLCVLKPLGSRDISYYREFLDKKRREIRTQKDHQVQHLHEWPTTLLLLTQSKLISSLCFLHSSLAKFKSKTGFFFFFKHAFHVMTQAPLGHSRAKTVLYYSWHFTPFPSAVLQQLQVLSCCE